jgi:hypothetical protein
MRPCLSDRTLRSTCRARRGQPRNLAASAIAARAWRSLPASNWPRSDARRARAGLARWQRSGAAAHPQDAPSSPSARQRPAPARRGLRRVRGAPHATRACFRSGPIRPGCPVPPGLGYRAPTTSAPAIGSRSVRGPTRRDQLVGSGLGSPSKLLPADLMAPGGLTLRV